MRVIFGLLCPLTITSLEFKSRKELRQQPQVFFATEICHVFQTAAEHEQHANEDEDSREAVSRFSDGSDDEDFREKEVSEFWHIFNHF